MTATVAIATPPDIALALALDEAVNARDAAVALLLDATLLLSKGGDPAAIETFHRRVGTLVVRIDRSDARRKAEGTLR